MIEFISIVSTAVDLGLNLGSNRKIIKDLFRSKYLCYDLAKLKSIYVNTTLIGKKIPYEEIYSLIHKPDTTIKFQINENEFHLSDDNLTEIKSFQSDALSEFKNNGKMLFDSQTVRLEKFEVENNVISFTVSKSKYSDQVQTHLVLDWKNKHLKEIGLSSYRGYLVSKYGKQLPPLNTALLSNSIGISVILYFQKDNCFIPYLPLRNKSIFNKKKNDPALCEGTYTSSSSSVLEWNEKEITIDYIKNEMFKEIYEELGIEKKDIDFLECIAFVRELLRAGKPQVFFVGQINLTEEQIILKRKEAILKNKIDNFAKVEIKNQHLSFLDLKSGIKNKILSLESIGNLYYSEKYMNSLQNSNI
jgi:hypothetical protein